MWRVKEEIGEVGKRGRVVGERECDGNVVGVEGDGVEDGVREEGNCNELPSQKLQLEGAVKRNKSSVNSAVLLVTASESSRDSLSLLILYCQ